MNKQFGKIDREFKENSDSIYRIFLLSSDCISDDDGSFRIDAETINSKICESDSEIRNLLKANKWNSVSVSRAGNSEYSRLSVTLNIFDCPFPSGGFSAIVVTDSKNGAAPGTESKFLTTREGLSFYASVFR